MKNESGFNSVKILETLKVEGVSTFSGGYTTIDFAKYGIKGDGITDDTSAIQNAIDELVQNGYSHIHFTAGTFIINPSVGINIPSNCIITGDKTIFKIGDNVNLTGNLIRIENKENVVIEDITLDGNKANNPDVTNYGLYTADSQNCRINRVITHSFTGVGNQVYDCDGTTVMNCYSYNNDFHGFECEQNRGCKFLMNRGALNARHGIFIAPGEIGGSGSIGNVIAYNEFDNNSNYGIAVGIAANVAPVNLTKDNLIIGNIVHDNTEYGIHNYYQDDNTIAFNSVYNNGFFGIFNQGGRNVKIDSNRLANNSQDGAGLYDEIAVDKLTVTWDNGNESETKYPKTSITNNNVRIDESVKARYGINELSGDDTGTDPNYFFESLIYENIVDSGLTGKYQIQGSKSVIDNISGTHVVGGGNAIDGNYAGIDNAFNILRLFSNLSNSDVQVVSTSGRVVMYSKGVETLIIDEGNVVLPNLPTSSAGLPSGSVWNDSGTLKIV